MNEDDYSDDDYDQEYAEGYSAYKYDDEDYDSGYEDGYADGYEDVEEEYVDEYIDDYVGDGDYDAVYEEPAQGHHKKVEHSSGINPHHVMLGAAGAALGHAAIKKAASKRRQQQVPQKGQNVAPQSAPASEWDKKMDSCILNGCALVVVASIVMFFVWCCS